MTTIPSADPLTRATELQKKLAGEIMVSVPLSLIQELIAEIQLLKQLDRARKYSRKNKGEDK